MSGLSFSSGLRRRLISMLETTAPRLAVRLRAMKALKTGEPELHLLPLLVDRSKTAVDVGGNVGIYAWHLAGLAAHVHVFEPIPMLQALLRRSFASGVTIHACALSDKPGSAVLTIPGLTGWASLEPRGGYGGRKLETITVETRRLDDATDLGDVGFVKIDVEGHEFAVLQGATGLMERVGPSVLIEIEERHAPGNIARVRNYFEALGYRGFFLLDGRARDIAEFSIEVHQPASAIDADGMVAGGVYVNNFLFVRAPAAIAALTAWRG